MSSIEASFITRQEPLLYVSQYFHDEAVNRHSHEFYEFVYVESGFSVHNLNDSVSILIQGDIFGIKPGDFHSYFNVRDSKIYNCLFFKEALGDNIHKLSLLPGLQSIFGTNPSGTNEKKVHLNILQRQEISSLLNKMQIECHDYRSSSELKLKAHLIDFLILLSRAFESNKEVNSCIEYTQTKGIIKAMEYIDKNYMNKIKIEELASLCSLSPDYFSKCFKSLCGLTPTGYLQYLRISKASQLLLNTDMSIASISSSIGIEDSNYFTRIFKKATGLAPAAYKKKKILF